MNKDLEIGGKSTTLDYLRVRYEWLGVAIEEYEKRIEELEKILGETNEALAACQAETGWRPIENAPKDGTYILVTSGDSGGSWVAYYCPVYQSGYKPKVPWSSVMINHKHLKYMSSDVMPTHWMPLPSLPKRQRGEGYLGGFNP